MNLLQDSATGWDRSGKRTPDPERPVWSVRREGGGRRQRAKEEEEKTLAADRHHGDLEQRQGTDSLISLSYLSLIPSNLVQDDPSGQQLYFVDFDLWVPLCCLHGMSILADLQKGPKHNKADIATSELPIKVNKM